VPLDVGAPPKAIIDDSERHVMILTIWDADAETKVLAITRWKSGVIESLFSEPYFVMQS